MKKKKIKLCLTKQLLNMFKLWCEWGIKFIVKISNFAFSVACPTNSLYDENVVPANLPEYLSCGAFHTVMLVCWLK